MNKAAKDSQRGSKHSKDIYLTHNKRNANLKAQFNYIQKEVHFKKHRKPCLRLERYKT